MADIELHGVLYRYTSGEETVEVLNNVSMRVEAGSFCSVSGPSGSGKSTLLNLIGLIDRPQAGSVAVAGAEIHDMPERERVDFRSRNIGFVFQSYHLIPVLTAAENVAWPLYFQGVPRRLRTERARDMLARVGLADQADRRLPRLSGGQQQRVAIARALVTEPRIVLADELTANLDRSTAAGVIDLIAKLNRDTGATILLATHDPLVESKVSRRLRIFGGAVEETPAADELHA